ncbi:sugar transporter [Pelobium manganitolerans]|uniref:Sugar transporter n=1 Tax=Pelobium manganitolerans TaxID=1842495 RepID=A0A419S4N8_9SPHI|nr:polysaccharide biosynthesis/export family protein [Pelobium manganitolerans]RKD15068.1 sugar transporter [Pelobium manganitolerans]
MNKSYIFIFSLLIVVISSCGSYKDIPYYQDLKSSKPVEEPITNYAPLTIQPGDILGINVNSRNPESSAIFNYNLNRINGNNFDNSSDNPVTGYLVNDKGEIDLPLLGVLKVTGLTTTQLTEKMRPLLLNFYKDPTVSVRIINFKVAVYGDVQKPDVYTFQNERTTITQALTMAGDLNVTAKRKNIILIREINGVRKYLPIDLTSKKIFESPYYYLKNNDEIYVTPGRTKYAQVDIGYRNATLILSALSIIAITFSTLYR